MRILGILIAVCAVTLACEQARDTADAVGEEAQSFSEAAGELASDVAAEAGEVEEEAEEAREARP